MPHPTRFRAAIVTLLAIGFVASLTLLPAPVEGPAPSSRFLCLIGCGDESIRDVVGNIILFIPLGWALRHWMSGRRAIATCLVTTVVIEALQATVIAGRDSSLRDILSNTAGGAVGAWLFTGWPALLRPTPSRSRALGAGAALGWLLVLAASGIGNRITPSNARWFGFWTPELAYYQTYSGRLLQVGVDGWTPENGPITDPRPLRRAMEQDSFLLSLDLITGAKPSGPSLIFAVIDTNESPQVRIGQERSALWLSWRNRFETWEMRGTTVRIPIMPGVAPGSRVLVEAGQANRRIFLRATSAGSTREIEVPETVGLGWTAIMPFRFAISDEWAVFNPVWLAGLIVPLAYWLIRGAPVTGLLLTATALAAGLFLIPVMTRSAPTTRPEWIGGIAGALGGMALGLWSRRASPSEPARA